MDTYERIRLIRKSQFKLTQEQFGERLGVSRSVIANIETNVLARPEQKEPLLKLICKEFNVSYEWLTTGEGSMFVENDDTILSALRTEYGLDDLDEKILTSYLKMPNHQRESVKDFILDVAKRIEIDHIRQFHNSVINEIQNTDLSKEAEDGLFERVTASMQMLFGVGEGEEDRRHARPDFFSEQNGNEDARPAAESEEANDGGRQATNTDNFDDWNKGITEEEALQLARDRYAAAKRAAQESTISKKHGRHA